MCLYKLQNYNKNNNKPTNSTDTCSAGNKLKFAVQSSPTFSNGLNSNTKNQLSAVWAGLPPTKKQPTSSSTAICSAVEKCSGGNKCQLQHADECIQVLKNIPAHLHCSLPSFPAFLPRFSFFLGFRSQFPCWSSTWLLHIHDHLIHAPSILLHQVPAVARSSHTSVLANLLIFLFSPSTYPLLPFLPCPCFSAVHLLSASAYSFGVPS